MVIAPGTRVPELSLRREDGGAFSVEDLDGGPTVLVLYPFAFSEVCTHQLTQLDGVRGEIAARGARLYGVSCDATPSQTAFRRSLGVEIEQLSDWEPKGASCRALGAYHPAGMAERALVLVGGDRVVRWSWIGEHPGVLPETGLVLDALAAHA